jgi:hypothetical protein
MARIYTNENFYRPVVVKLREFGHDVLTSLEAGQANKKIPDEDVLLFAVAEKRVMLTLNRRHFMRLHRLNSQHCGIIVCTEDADFEALAVRIHEVLEQAGDLDNQLVKGN